MGRLFDSPIHLLILLIVVLLIFGAPKLPGMARSLGQSMRIFKSEVNEMKKDKKSDAPQTVVNGEVINNGADQNTGASAGTAQNGQTSDNGSSTTTS